MVSKHFSKFTSSVTVTGLVLVSLALGTGCSAMSTTQPAANLPATSSTQSDSRIAHFDRQSLERTFF